MTLTRLMLLLLAIGCGVLPFTERHPESGHYCEVPTSFSDEIQSRMPDKASTGTVGSN